MVWTAIFDGATNQHGRWDFSIVYTDGSAKHRRQYSSVTLGAKVLRQFASSEITKLETAAEAVGKVLLNTGDAIDLTPDAPPAVTNGQKAADLFSDEYRRLQSFLRGVDAGLIAANDLRISTLRENLKLAVENHLGLL